MDLNVVRRFAKKYSDGGDEEEKIEKGLEKLFQLIVLFCTAKVSLNEGFYEKTTFVEIYVAPVGSYLSVGVSLAKDMVEKRIERFEWDFGEAEINKLFLKLFGS